MFVIKKIKNIDNYAGFIIFLDTDNGIFDMINEIEKELNKQNIEGKILIDQLLLTGNSFNRFVECNFKSKIDFRTAHNINPDNLSYNFRLETFKYLHRHYEYVENSILTDKQKEFIKKGAGL